MPERGGSTRRATAVLAAVFAVAAAGYVALWLFSVNELKSGVADWAEEQRAAGLAVDYGAIRSGGFPARVRARLRDVVIEDDGALRWAAPQVDVDFSFLAPSRLAFSSKTLQELRIEGLGAFVIDAPEGSAAISGDEQSWRLRVVSTNGLVRSADGGDTLRIGDLDLVVQQSPATEDRIQLSLDAADIDVTHGAESVTGDAASADVWVIGAEALASGEGGAIDMRSVHLELAGARIKISGVLLIAPGGAVFGRLETDVANPGAAALAAGRLGLISRQDAEAAAGALTLAALAGGGRVVGPLTIDADGIFFAGVRLSADQPRAPVVQP